MAKPELGPTTEGRLMIGSIDRWSGLRQSVQAVALVVGVFGFGTTLAAAQQGQQPNQTPPPNLATPSGEYSAWVKICTTGEETQNKQVCLIKYEGLDPKTGEVQVTAVVRTTEGEDKSELMIGVPSSHTLVIPAGVQIKIDEAEPIQMQYKLCIKQSCQAHSVLTKQMLDMMRKGQRILVVALDIQQKLVGLSVPLDGFTKTFDGAPVDEAQYKETRLRLMEGAKKAAEDYQQRLKQGGQSPAPATGAQPNATIAVPKAPAPE
ncbi:MAG: invasion associated locus B family protein [Methyloceanibacter sp.]